MPVMNGRRRHIFKLLINKWRTVILCVAILECKIELWRISAPNGFSNWKELSLSVLLDDTTCMSQEKDAILIVNGEKLLPNKAKENDMHWKLEKKGDNCHASSHKITLNFIFIHFIFARNSVSHNPREGITQFRQLKSKIQILH